jgi:hypothetical protein
VDDVSPVVGWVILAVMVTLSLVLVLAAIGLVLVTWWTNWRETGRIHLRGPRRE